MKLFVAKLSFTTTNESLAAFFGKFAPFNSCEIVTDKHTGSSRGFAFIEIEDAALASRAIAELHGKSLDGRQIIVSEARLPLAKKKGASGRSSKGDELGYGYRN